MSSRSKKISLAMVISKVKNIAEEKYEGKLYDNVISIYNQLTSVERRVLLRGLIGICLTIEDKILEEHIASGQEPGRVQREERRTEQPDEDDDTPVEQRPERKAWKLRIFSVLAISGLLSLTVGSFFLSGENGVILLVEKIVKLFKLFI